ncbi:MAG: ribosome-associated translation inhibitor RaiA [Solirubrobacterales bacterium]|nr:ribosome-associated translation inhibitor RaiA [Solirubrobacterales bacterium]
MRIDVKGRNLPISDELRAHVERKFKKVSAQVSKLADMEVDLLHETNPKITDSEVARVTLHLKGVTLRACAASHEIHHSVNLAAEEIAVQVKRHREKRRHRREARQMSPRTLAPGMTPGESGASPA